MDGVTVEQKKETAFYISTQYRSESRMSAYVHDEDGETVIWCNYGTDLSLCMSPSTARELVDVIEEVLLPLESEQDNAT